MSSESVEKLQVNSPTLSEEKSHSEILSIADDGDQQILPATNGTAKPSCGQNANGIAEIDKPQRLFGWFGIQPKFMQKFLSAKWALFWLCWAGALQGG